MFQELIVTPERWWGGARRWGRVKPTKILDLKGLKKPLESSDR